MRQELAKAYDQEPFVELLPEGQLAQTGPVSYTNQCHIQIHADPSETVLVLTAAIDNLGKGAAGQALQNGNIMLGLSETTGLI
jgi:N-acetyl-gamma-glutamyl-phosphate reductase